eukprot:CAMPEP_0197823838 /NCGR_PEP_ID=MMETSP1437-20131217/1153_1 /TAXON_ID=49252 ORGANISM="Eucampia antarctica, Strain CCMP1452" /NCGR_SAMPLE_ID=MMETSP1437 /ASSEMBLY_ACC=CAM_ASM_001096 /LENGTH=137 /DNA_ID=CAMNT_0043423201 /DNA_START=1 /DNA_END=414 /DNA_ORIENTATION=-
MALNNTVGRCLGWSSSSSTLLWGRNAVGNSVCKRLYVSGTVPARMMADNDGSSSAAVGMIPGTTIEGLDFKKNVDPVLSKERSEYPEWLSTLATPMTNLASLRKLPKEQASDVQMMRYLKLTRRIRIKELNQGGSIK